MDQIYVVSALSVVGMTFIGMYILNWCHPALSMKDFVNVDALLDHKIKRDRFFREEQLGWAALNVVASVALAFGFSELTLLTFVLVTGIFVSWLLHRALCPRPMQLFFWDSVDIHVLAIALLIGSTAALVTASVIAIPFAMVGWPIFLFTLAWVMLMVV